jgi:hypothetical protein
MRKALLFTALAAVLVTPAYLAAQEPPKGEAERQSPPSQTDGSTKTIAPMGTNPGTVNSQPQAPQADQAKPADVGPAQANTANTAGNSGSQWPLGSTRQTAPSTVSAENDKLDKLPVIAYSFWLNDADKKLIVQGVANAPKADGKINSAKVADLLPPGVESVSFPAEITQKLPIAGRYAYVKTDNRVLVVDPNLKIIVAEVSI